MCGSLYPDCHAGASFGPAVCHGLRFTQEGLLGVSLATSQVALPRDRPQGPSSFG